MNDDNWTVTAMTKIPPAIQLVNMKIEAAHIFQSHGIAPPDDPSELLLTELSVAEPTGSRSMSNQLLDRIFPKTGSTDAVHFTTPDVLPNLIEHKALWLASVAKNLNEGEYEAFSVEHGFASAQSQEIREELARNYFYTSFSPVGTAAKSSHWNIFGASG